MNRKPYIIPSKTNNKNMERYLQKKLSEVGEGGGGDGSGGKSPYIGENGHWFEWNAEQQQFVDTGVTARGPQGPQGIQGNTGSNVAYPFELVNNRTTNDPEKALSAAEGYRIGEDITQLEAKVTDIEHHFSEKITTETDITTTDYDGVQTGFYLGPNGAIYSSQYYSVYRKHFTEETEIDFSFLEANLGMAVSDTEGGAKTVVAYYPVDPGKYTIPAGKWLYWDVQNQRTEKTSIVIKTESYGELKDYASEEQVLAVDAKVDETNERIDDAGLESNTKTLTDTDFCDLVVSSGTFIQANSTYNSFYLPMRKGAFYKITGSVSNIYTTDTKPELNIVANVLTLRTNTELIAGDDDKYLFLTVAVASYGSVTVKEEYGVALENNILFGNAFTQYTTRGDFNTYIKWMYIENGMPDMMVNLFILNGKQVTFRVVKSTDVSVYYAYASELPYKPGVPVVINGFGGSNLRIYIIFNEGTFNNQGYSAFLTDAAFALKTDGFGISEKNFLEIFKPLNGQSILFLGDSVLEFTDDSGNTYPDYVGGVTGATIYNGAIGGTRISKRPTTGGDPRYRPFDVSSLVDAIATGDWTEQEVAAEDLKSSYPQYETIIARMKSIDYTKLDAIVINGGSNDWSSSIPFGDNDSEDTATFRGAINYIVKTLLTAYQQLRVYFVTNSVRYWVSITPAQWCTIYQNTQGKTLEDYTNETIVMANRNNIPSYDWFHECGINPYNFAKYFGTNSAHINKYARFYFASKIGAYLMRDFKPM